MNDPFSRPMKLGAHIVPGIWRYMFPDDLRYSKFPSECGSSCSNCPKIEAEGFHPEYRCCTYHPRMPNFLLGLALQDPATAPLIEAMIAEGFATPEGMQATTAQARTALKQHAANEFGKVPSVACRFLNRADGKCQVYKYRNSVCSTFFCIHDHGNEGADFWDTLQSAGNQVETALAQWAMAETGIDVEEYFDRFDTMADRLDSLTDATQAWTKETQALLWGEWLGREAEFYRVCADLVRKNVARLSTIPNDVKLRTPKLYDKAFNAALSDELRRERNADGATEGEPVPPSDLWYQFRLAHRNLWRPAETETES